MFLSITQLRRVLKQSLNKCRNIKSSCIFLLVILYRPNHIDMHPFHLLINKLENKQFIFNIPNKWSSLSIDLFLPASKKELQSATPWWPPLWGETDTLGDPIKACFLIASVSCHYLTKYGTCKRNLRGGFKDVKAVLHDKV